MGAPARSRELSHAGGGLAAYSDVARSALSGLFADRSGTTAIEYAMIAGGLSIAVITAVNLLGQNVETMFFSKLAGLFN
jgi:pilus assembly protein Flp/PilA